MTAWLGREDSNLRMVESKSGYFINDYNGFSDKSADSVPRLINRLEAQSEYHAPSSRRLVGSNQGHATISNYYSKQRLKRPPNVGGRRYSPWKSPDFRNVFRSRSDISQLSGRLRSLGNFFLSEWRLRARARPVQAICRWLHSALLLIFYSLLDL